MTYVTLTKARMFTPPHVIFFFGGLFVFIPISYESPTGAAPLSLSGLWVADVKPLSPCPLSQLLRVTLLRIKYLLT